MALVPKHWPTRSLSWPRHQVEKTHRHSPHDLLPLLRRNVSGPRGPFFFVVSLMPKHLRPHDSVRTSSLGVPKDRPSAVQGVSRPLQVQIPKEVHSRHEAAKPHTRAVLVVSHDLDGLLRITPCRFVAPCCRLWGSPRFRVFPTSPHRCKHRLTLLVPPFPCGAGPFEVFPSSTAPVTSPRPIPSRCSSSWSLRCPTQAPNIGSSTGQPTSGLCSVAESVAARRRCRRHTARYSLGLLPSRQCRVSGAVHEVDRADTQHELPKKHELIAGF